jgi:predicted nucleic acid-binding protein
MRTTVDIPDAMYRQLKSRAVREGSSTRALILRGVTEVLKTKRRKAGRPAVMGDEVMTQPAAWIAYDRWRQDARVELADEPAALEPRFRSLTRLRRPATKDWADSYLAAFATVGQLTLVTFDRGLRAKTKSLVVLQ